MVQVCLANTIVKTKNGIIRGTHNYEFKQDFFLGIPYAFPPTGSLRFASPQPYNKTWDNVKVHDKYGDSCISVGNSGNYGLNQSEDCLTLNVVRPEGNHKDLPVAIWIYGGAFVDGASATPSYNLSYIVQNSVEIGKPIIAVSLNYRLGGFGFLNAEAAIAKNWTNVGLRDQLTAIEWVRENIEAFGGDPDHLVIWGESAGAMSVGFLLNSGMLGDYVQGAIMESGTSIISQVGYAGLQESDYTALTKHFNCTGNDTLGCLQKVDSHDLQYVFNKTNKVLPGQNYIFPYIDYQVIPKSGYNTLEKGNFTKVPILLGTTTDEGTSFIPSSLQNEELFLAYIKMNFPLMSNATVQELLSLYPLNDTSLHTPLDPTYNTSEIIFPSSYNVSLYPTIATLATDVLFAGPTRITAESFVNQSLPVFKYRHNIPNLADAEHPWTGVGHFKEIVYVFDNPTNLTKGAWDASEKSANASADISKHWVSFISDLDPNWDDDAELWPEYGESEQNQVFDLRGFYVEDDDWREEQIDYFRNIHNQLNY